jgi:ubiquinone/menaquinone biosynthesis C-methylase UbiE
VTKVVDRNLPPGTTGFIVHAAARYDFLVWLMTFGRERVFREKILRLAGLQSAEAVLDVGCGTGSLALAAKRAVGPGGSVHAIDASPEMLARAARKARKAGLEVFFRQAAAQALPFQDAGFDAVTGTMMLHHLPRKAREQFAGEIKRVLKPGGRALLVDFAAPTRPRKSSHFHLHRHGGIDLEDIIAMLSEAGLNIVESGAVGFRNLHFALATNPS